MAGMVCNIFLTKRICMTANSLTAKGGRLGRAGYLLLHHGHDVYLQFRTADLRADPCPGLCCERSHTIGLSKLAAAKKIGWLNDYIMSVALIVGMASAVLFTNILGWKELLAL